MRRYILIILMIMLVSTSSLMASEDYSDYASKLQVINVFKGTNEGFELDRAPSRLEGLIMFIRLLGKEDEALNGTFIHPFDDVPLWADSYVGFAYENGYTKGISDTKFGTGDIGLKLYITFVLRALGYDDSSGDFTWSESVTFALDKQLVSDDDVSSYSKGTFLRGHVAKISYDALSTNVKNGKALIDTLVEAGAFSEEDVNKLGLNYTVNEDEAKVIYTDIAGHWAEEYIIEATNRGLMAGFSDGTVGAKETFRPDDYIRRSKFVMYLVKAIGKEDEITSTLANRYIDYAFESGIFDEYYEYYNTLRRDMYGNYTDNMFKSETAMYISRAIVINSLDSDYFFFINRRTS